MPYKTVLYTFYSVFSKGFLLPLTLEKIRRKYDSTKINLIVSARRSVGFPTDSRIFFYIDTVGRVLNSLSSANHEPQSHQILLRVVRRRLLHNESRLSYLNGYSLSTKSRLLTEH